MSNLNDYIDRLDNEQARIDNVLKYIQENPESDPNAYEMNEIMFEVAQIGWDGREFEKSSYDMVNDKVPEYQRDERIIKYRNLKASFNKMMSFRMDQFKYDTQDLRTSSRDPLYEYFDEAQRRMATLNSLGNKELSDIYSKACGINLYIKQQERDKGPRDILYNNNQELKDLLNKFDNYEKKYGKSQKTEPFTSLTSQIKEKFGKTKEELTREIEYDKPDDPSL